MADEYIDDGYSGREVKRPAYQRMMDEKDKWDVLVVLKMDRIHRNSRNFAVMMDNLRDWGKEFNSMQESFDTTTAIGRFVMDTIQRIAQLESEQIGERVKMGMTQKAKKGNGYLGFGEPYGYEYLDKKLRVCAGLKKGPHRVFLPRGRFPTGREITVSGATTLLDSRIMAEVVEAQEGDFELDVARAIVRLHFSDAQNEQMRELADKNNRGELTEEERDKLESYRRVGNFLALLQSKARLSLEHAGLWQR